MLVVAGGSLQLQPPPVEARAHAGAGPPQLASLFIWIEAAQAQAGRAAGIVARHASSTAFSVYRAAQASPEPYTGIGQHRPTFISSSPPYTSPVSTIL